MKYINLFNNCDAIEQETTNTKYDKCLQRT